MLSFGIPSSSSVYFLWIFFFLARDWAGLVFCCLGKGSLDFLETRGFEESGRRELDLSDIDGLFGPLDTCFERIVLVLLIVKR